jgi:hypothetical protein
MLKCNIKILFGEFNWKEIQKRKFNHEKGEKNLQKKRSEIYI